MINITNPEITLSRMREIVDYHKPFDTGYFFTFGNRYNENEHFKVVTYDLVTVPYIQFLEEGTIFSQRHVGFIREKTVQAITANQISNDALVSRNQSLSNQISEGVLEHIKGYGRAGGRYDKFIGI